MKRTTGLLMVAMLAVGMAARAGGFGRAALQDSKPTLTQQPTSPSAQKPAGQASQAAAAPPAAYQPTPDEVAAVKAIQTELDPNRTLQLVGDFEKKYPGSPNLQTVYLYAAQAYRQTNKLDKAIEYAEKIVKLNGNNILGLMTLAELLPQPQMLQGLGDADRDKRLTEAQTDAEHALELITAMPKQPNQTDEQLANNKKLLAAGVHGSLGLVHLQRATESLSGNDPGELAKAETEYKAALAVDKPDEANYFRLGEVLQSENKLDDAIQAFSKASEISQGNGDSALQSMADQEVQKLKRAKPAAAPAAKP
ncbi:MAG TPA: hypothetical protein VGW33_14615 [Terriglobia bacterium]|nr:hypothetical protein [Terriglobia bacterium]